MPSRPLKSSQLQEQLRELEEEAAKKKVKLTPEVQQYIREHLEIVQEKLVKGEPVFEEDMEFMDLARRWILMPEFWRKEHANIEGDLLRQLTENAMYEDVQEAGMRDILPEQWLDLLHVAEASKNEKEWIDKEFKFPGDGIIEVDDRLWLGYCTSLTRLPKGLKVGWHLNLDGCSSLAELPSDLQVRGSLLLKDCTSLKALPEQLHAEFNLSLRGCTLIKELPKGLKVDGDLFLEGCEGLKKNKQKVLPVLFQKLSAGEIGGVDLSYWPLEDDDLPDKLQVGWSLDIKNCNLLTSLPKELYVGHNLYLESCTGLKKLPGEMNIGEGYESEGIGSLYLSENVSEQVKEDAKRLKQKGKIQGKVDYNDNRIIL